MNLSKNCERSFLWPLKTLKDLKEWIKWAPVPAASSCCCSSSCYLISKRKILFLEQVLQALFDFPADVFQEMEQNDCTVEQEASINCRCLNPAMGNNCLSLVDSISEISTTNYPLVDVYSNDISTGLVYLCQASIGKSP
uniref:Uncharacterized protein n=1 Tax=Micrurus spixii TaxID=129469 RepID=A0A2D4MYL8_9SAUR